MNCTYAILTSGLLAGICGLETAVSGGAQREFSQPAHPDFHPAHLGNLAACENHLGVHGCVPNTEMNEPNAASLFWRPFRRVPPAQFGSPVGRRHEWPSQE